MGHITIEIRPKLLKKKKIKIFFYLCSDNLGQNILTRPQIYPFPSPSSPLVNVELWNDHPWQGKLSPPLPPLVNVGLYAVVCYFCTLSWHMRSDRNWTIVLVMTNHAQSSKWVIEWPAMAHKPTLTKGGGGSGNFDSRVNYFGQDCLSRGNFFFNFNFFLLFRNWFDHCVARQWFFIHSCVCKSVCPSHI